MILQPVLVAIGEQQVLEMRYRSRNEEQPQHRFIEPVGLYQQGQHWYAIAYCRMRQAYRNFRTDRISDLRGTGERFTTQHLTLRAYLKRMSESQKADKVVIEINAEIAKYIQTTRYNYGFVTEAQTETGIEMTFLAPSLEGIARGLLMFMDQARILEPAGLQERVHDLAAAIVKKSAQPERLLT